MTAFDVRVPPEWPWRKDGDPVPYYCVRCGRVLDLRFWRTVGGERRYWYLACDGEGLDGFLRRLFPLSWSPTKRGHWTFDLGPTPEPPTFDPSTGKMVDR